MNDTILDTALGAIRELGVCLFADRDADEALSLLAGYAAHVPGRGAAVERNSYDELVDHLANVLEHCDDATLDTVMTYSFGVYPESYAGRAREFFAMVLHSIEQGIARR